MFRRSFANHTPTLQASFGASSHATESIETSSKAPMRIIPRTATTWRAETVSSVPFAFASTLPPSMSLQFTLFFC